MEQPHIIQMVNRFFYSNTATFFRLSTRVSLPCELTTMISGSILILCVFFVFPYPAWGQTIALSNTLSEIEKLDKRFQKVSADYYKSFARQNPQNEILNFDKLSQLHLKIHEFEEKDQYVEAISLITNNMTLISNNTDVPSITYFISLLLEYNEWNSAVALFEVIQQNSNKIIVSKAQYEFAKYYFKRQNWKQSLDYLEGIFTDIVTDDAHYALLIKGISLQRLKKHRTAIKVYESIPDTSIYYAYATLNKAVAYIRQDWWTDAHLAINEILQQHRDDISNDMANRLFVILGYSQMRKEYYRNARETFRKVNLDSKYANRALLGLSLTAANQNDFTGALNAATILNAKMSSDLTTEESYLLLPYLYSKFNQPLTASAHFGKAIDHYTQRIKEINKLLSNINDNPNTNIKITDNNNELIFSGYSLDFTRLYPKYFLENYVALKKIINTSNDQNIRNSLNKLYLDYQTVLIKIIHELLKQRIVYLNSYIDQSRFGLARVYDITSISE